MPSIFLFLDLDGVINGETCKDTKYVIRENGSLDIDVYSPKACSVLNTFLSQVNAYIVLTSAWRVVYPISEMNKIFKEQFKIDAEISSYTSSDWLDKDYSERIIYDPTSTGRERGLQITQWLEKNNLCGTKYIVIDDSLDASYGHEKQYYRTSLATGLVEEDLPHLFKILNG